MKKINFIYNACVMLLALISVAFTIADICGASVVTQPWFYPVDNAILILFTFDYFVRLVLAGHKWRFIKENIFDLLAIIPFNTLFSMFRILRVFRIIKLAKLTKLAKLFRLVGVGGRLKTRLHAFLHTNGLIYVIYVNVVCVLLGAIAIYLVEGGLTVHSFGDAIWWAFVTATTVGYGDISPSTGLGRVIAAILMICGIGLISMLTGTIATFFTVNAQHSEKEEKLEALKKAAEDLTPDEIENLIKQIKE